jgi:hypothetical protein
MPDVGAILHKLEQVKTEQAVTIGVVLTEMQRLKNLLEQEQDLYAQCKLEHERKSKVISNRLRAIANFCSFAATAESSSSSSEEGSGSYSSDGECQSQKSGSWTGADSASRRSESQEYNEAQVFGEESESDNGCVGFKRSRAGSSSA